jgi:hypothetical protein
MFDAISENFNIKSTAENIHLLPKQGDSPWHAYTHPHFYFNN